MKKKNVLKSLGYALVSLLLLACGQEQEKREQTIAQKIEINADGKRVLTVSLTGLEVGFDEELFKNIELPEELRTLNYKLSNKRGNKMGISSPALEDGDEVLLSMLFNYVGSQEKPLVAEDLVFVWDASHKVLKMKPKQAARVQLIGEASSEDERQPIASGSKEEEDAVRDKQWAYALVYKPKGAGFDNGTLLISSSPFEAFKRVENEEDPESPATHKLDGTATDGKIDLSGFPMASQWTKFDMTELLTWSKLSEEQKKAKLKSPLPKAEGLAPRGYFFILSFQNQIPNNQTYKINRIRVKSQYLSYRGEINFVPPIYRQYGSVLGNPVSYRSSYGDQGWHYTLGNNAETLRQGEKGRYYFFWGLFTQGQSPNFQPKIKIEIEGEPLQGEGKTKYSFPWFDNLTRLADQRANAGRILLYTLSGKTETETQPTPPGGGTNPNPAPKEETLNPFDYFTSNYVRSEDAVRNNQIAEEVPEHERTRVQGVSSSVFYETHSGNGNILRTHTWVPKANARPNDRRWPSLSDWVTFLPLSNANRTQASKFDPDLDTEIFRQLNKWWNMKVPGHPNFTKKVRRHLDNLAKQEIPQNRPNENGRTVYEIFGSKEIVNIHTSRGEDFTMALGAEYIAHTDNGVPNKVFYGKRFMGVHDISKLHIDGKPVTSADINDPNVRGNVVETEIAARYPENSLLSAWRYEAIKEGTKYTGFTLTIKVEYVFLGSNRATETIENIGTEAWWNTERANGNVREMQLRTPRYHHAYKAVPHLTTSYYQDKGVALFIDDDAVWYEDIRNYRTNTNTDYYLKLAIEPTSSASGLGGN